MKRVVYHTYYGCDTGCCGHAVTMLDDDEEFDEYNSHNSRKFTFYSADGNSEEDKLEFAKDLVRQEFGEEHVKDLDWEHSLVLDWSEC